MLVYVYLKRLMLKIMKDDDQKEVLEGLRDVVDIDYKG